MTGDLYSYYLEEKKMRFKNKNMKKLLGLMTMLAMMIGIATASGVQASAASVGLADISVGETLKTLTKGYVSDSLMVLLVVIIVMLVLALVAVVVVIVVISNKKKENNPPQNQMPSPAPTNAQSFNRVQPMNPPVNQPVNQPANQPMNRPVNQPVNQPVNRPVNQPTSRPQSPAGFNQNNLSEKTQFPVDGAGDTTVLGAGSAGFILMRKNGSEKISINKPEFYIGKERAKVDYCITNNNSISRRHAKIKVRAGKCYISDLGSTNCTYINGTKLSPNQEVALIPGDKVKLSNEEFEFIG